MSLIIRQIKITGHFQIISGQQIPKPNLSTKGEVVDPYVKVRVCGLDCDDHNIVTNNKYTTKTINNNGFRYVYIGPLLERKNQPSRERPGTGTVREFLNLTFILVPVGMKYMNS